MNLHQVSLVLRNIVFVIVQPGIVAGIIPFMIAKISFVRVFTNSFMLNHFIGISLFLLGALVMFHCVVRFASDGLGTLSPADPTKKLVTSELCKFSRNPMYVGVMLILLGEAVFTLSAYLLIYSVGILFLFNMYIVYFEEPRLKKDFGQDYKTYSKSVRKWI